MLLGCCHCESDSSSSSSVSSSSVSSESSGPGTVIRPSCAPRCIGNEAPLALSIAVTADPGTQNPCFTAHYLGSFALFITSNPTSCIPYYSVELAKKTPACSDVAAQVRWSAGIGLVYPGPITRIEIGGFAEISGFVSRVCLYRVSIGASPVNCVSSWTATRISTNSIGWPFATTMGVAAL